MISEEPQNKNKLQFVILHTDPEFRGALADILKRAFACDVTVFGLPDDALRHLQDHKPNLFLPQAFLQNSDGHEVIRTIKQDPANRFPVVVITGGGRIFREEATRAGADVVINSPFDVDTFLETVQDLLHRG